jgi:hypothetical protein
MWGARYTLGARYLSKNTVLLFQIQIKQLLFVYYFIFGVLGFNTVTVTYVKANRTR